MRARSLKPGFFENEELAECSAWARLCFAGLWMLADREGRLEDRPRRIKGALFRFDSLEIEPLLDELEAHGFILRYGNEDGRFIEILAFKKHQTPHYSEKPSTIKPPVLAKPEVIMPATLPESDGHDDDEFRRTPENSGVDPPSRGGRNPLTPDSGLLTPDSGSCSSLRSELAVSRSARSPPPATVERKRPPKPPPLPPFDGSNAEVLNGRAVVRLAEAWELPEQWGIDAEALGWRPADVLRQAELFRQYWTRGRGRDTRRSVKGWSQTWSNWLAKASSSNSSERPRP